MEFDGAAFGATADAARGVEGGGGLGTARQDEALQRLELRLERVDVPLEGLYALGLGGVPSFRLRGPAGSPDLSLWGQDRIFLLSREIARRTPA